MTSGLSREAFVEDIITRNDFELELIQKTATEISGKEATVEEAFDKPMKQGGARKDSEVPDWDDDQFAAAYSTLRSLGYGAEQNVASGFKGAAVEVESGLAWKFAYELTLLDEEAPSALFFGGSQFRVAGDKEHEFMLDKYGVELGKGATEYTIARAFAGLLVAKKEFEILPIGYAVAPGNTTIHAKTGQVQTFGKTKSGASVHVLRVDREQLDDKNYQYQPDTAGRLGVISDTMAMLGKKVPVVTATSQTYFDRGVDVVRAGLERDEEFGAAYFGRATLAEIKGEPIKGEMPREQVEGSLRVAYDKRLALGKVAAQKLTELQEG